MIGRGAVLFFIIYVPLIFNEKIYIIYHLEKQLFARKSRPCLSGEVVHRHCVGGGGESDPADEDDLEELLHRETGRVRQLLQGRLNQVYKSYILVKQRSSIQNLWEW